MHVETYPDFLTPRDEKPSLSSSEEKSSEFGQQENENERKGKTEQGSVYSIYLSILHTSISISLSYNGCKGIYIEKFFQPSQLRNLMIGGLQGDEWKFMQKYPKENISRGVRKTEEISHHAWAGAKLEGVVRISHKPGAVVF